MRIIGLCGWLALGTAAGVGYLAGQFSSVRESRHVVLAKSLEARVAPPWLADHSTDLVDLIDAAQPLPPRPSYIAAQTVEPPLAGESGVRLVQFESPEFTSRETDEPLPLTPVSFEKPSPFPQQMKPGEDTPPVNARPSIDVSKPSTCEEPQHPAQPLASPCPCHRINGESPFCHAVFRKEMPAPASNWLKQCWEQIYAVGHAKWQEWLQQYRQTHNDMP